MLVAVSTMDEEEVKFLEEIWLCFMAVFLAVDLFGCGYSWQWIFL